MATIDIATTDGDVILILQDTRLRVSSVILSSASPVFKTMFGPNFSEGQGDRSAENPKEVTLFDDDLAAMTRLCRLLHHQPDQEAFPQETTRDSLVQCAKDLHTLTGLVDKYYCADSLRMAGSYLLSQFGSSSIAHVLPLGALLALIAAAYTFGDGRYFALFTRCLVLDNTLNYSALLKHDVVASLPNSFLLLVEEQRRAALTLFTLELSNLASRTCGYCSLSTSTYLVPSFAEVAELSRNQLRLRESQPLVLCKTLRSILDRAYKCDNITLHSCKTLHSHEIIVTGTSLKDLCNKVSRIACGLCLTCLQDTEADAASCTHCHLLERWTENDPTS